MSRTTQKPKEEVKPCSLPWEEWLELFLLHQKAQGLAERTLDDYEYHVSLFFKKSATDNLKLAVMRYFADSANLSPYTFNTRRKKLKTFFEWTVAEELIPNNPMKDIAKRKEDEKPKSTSEEVLKRLLALPDTKTFVGVRDYAMFLLTMDTGIRPSEAFGLKPIDVNLKSLEINIPASVAKTRISRSLPISAITGEAIRKLMMSRHPAWKDAVPLFCTENGAPVSRFQWDKRLSKYSKDLGVKICPYQLRHSFAVIYLRSGGNAFALQRSLGHATLTMTRRYVALTESDLQQQHSIATPLNKLLPQRNRVRKIK